MSCTVSCSTDSGVRNPSTVRTFVAAGAGGGGGVGAGVEGAAGTAAVESVGRAGGRFSIWQPPATAIPHTANNPSLMALTPPSRSPPALDVLEHPQVDGPHDPVGVEL